MKGVIFTEFLEMVESKFGYETVDKIIINSDVASKGIYTSVGTYPHSEIVALITSLSEETGLTIDDLISTYGDYLFSYFVRNYKSYFEATSNVFDFLQSVDGYIHQEVLKLYPDAQLPEINTLVKEGDSNTLQLIYVSDRKMASLAESLIKNSINHFNEEIDLTRNDRTDDGREVEFILRRNINSLSHEQ